MLTLNKRQLAFRIVTPFIATGFFLLLLELSASLYIANFALPRDHYEFRKEQPPPYVDAPYFSQDFISESF